MRKIVTALVFFLSISCQYKASKDKAVEYWNNNQLELALREISIAIVLHPDSSSFYTLRAAIYDSKLRYEEELKDLNKIIELNVNEEEILMAYHQRAVVKSNLGLYKEALNDIDYVITHQKSTVCRLSEAYINKASILYKLDDIKGAKSFYNLALSDTANDIKVSAYLGLSNLANSPEKALELLNKAAKIDENNASILANRATIYLEQGEVDKAFYDSMKAFDIDPKNASNAFNIGQIYALYLNKPDSAVKYFERAIKLDPYSSESAPVYMNLSIMKKNYGDLKSAYNFAKKATELMPEDDKIQYNFAVILSDMRKNREALEAITKAIKINTQEIDYYNLKGVILVNMYLLKDAVEMFKKCIKLKPDFGGAYYNLGYIYGQLADAEQSIYYYKKAVDLNFTLEATLVNLALQEIKIDRTKSACIHLKKAYKLGRKDIKPLLDKYCR